MVCDLVCFFFNDTAPTEIYTYGHTLSLHDALPIVFEAKDAGADNAVLLDFDGYVTEGPGFNVFAVIDGTVVSPYRGALEGITRQSVLELDRKSTRLNSSH